MHRHADTFIENYTQESEADLISQLIRNTGGQVTVFSKDLLPHYHLQLPPQRPPKGSNQYISDIKVQALAHGDDGYFDVLGRGELKDQRMMYARIFEDELMLLISKGMGVASESSRMFFYFMFRTSILVYVIGVFVIYLIAGSISSPIVKMKRITKRMANLHFDEKLEVESKDEVGDLMNSINLMADELSGAINALSDSNHKLSKELSKEKSLEKMRRRFVSDVSHELKNPISMILAYADGLVQKIPRTEADKEEYYKIIMDEASRMNKLVKDLLDLSGYESGSFTIVKEPFIINELIDNAIERFSYIMDEKTIEIQYDACQRYELTADRLRISQVIINLLSNAFKHVNDHGIIKIELSNELGKLKLLIANTGELIPPNELNEIWNSFYQVNTGHKGNGLGLAIVKGIVELHNGSCRAYTIDGYNCFEIIL